MTSSEPQWTQGDYEAYMATARAEDRDGRKLASAIDRGLLANLGILPVTRRPVHS